MVLLSKRLRGGVASMNKKIVVFGSYVTDLTVFAPVRPFWGNILKAVRAGKVPIRQWQSIEPVQM